MFNVLIDNEDPIGFESPQSIWYFQTFDKKMFPDFSFVINVQDRFSQFTVT